MGTSSLVQQAWGSVGRVKQTIAAAAVLYAAVACIALAVLASIPSHWKWVADWIAVPSQGLAILATVIVVCEQRRTRGYSMHIWALVGVFSAASLVASFLWNEWRAAGNDRRLTVADCCYFFDYAVLTAAYALAYRHYGGSFRSIRTWLDGLTILVALLATFWATLLGPFTPPGQSQPMGVVFGGAYAVSIALLITMASLLYLRLPPARGRLIPVILIAAGIIDMVWEIAWLANWLRDLDFIGLYYNFGDVICFTLVVCAAIANPQQRGLESERENVERSAYTFLPILSALIATALIAIFLASTRAADAWILVGLVLLTALLLVMRQRAVRRDLAALNRAVAARASDARLTELVRQSADAFLIVDQHGIISYASPATDPILGVGPRDLLGKRVEAILGPGNEAAVGAFLARLIADAGPPQPLEVTVASELPVLRMVRVSGANRIGNPNIEGLALTLTDITALRHLERQVLELANQERLRLAGDIHEGLGQQLTGISMMLQGAAKAPDPDPARQQEYLQLIVTEMAEAICGARDLARELSEIYVVGGSLRSALEQLGKDAEGHPRVHINVDPRFDDRIVDDFPADHLFRIAQEAVQNANRHGQCSKTDVALQVHDDHLVLTIADDGCGYDHPPPANSGLGLRLMEYRARLIGGSFLVRRRAAAGTHVQVTVPLRYVLAEPAIS
ncbi:MAG: ATP-binding protein [Steroidobacteraceae bacterium]|jgi:PAS domain S-box-containing protein